ncbi:L-lactate dehydrogenase complex protein LldG [Pontibacter ummariensis]|uniref:L-lactate dehydrogenase complex protein LldG n=1 Tax=Pontibacter ummariensis TaxID=1610492 RepID=A0A239B5T4_9BACT|nr:LUD domain-containing protein [Pontibacter ummariensis]PRY16330.1 L-lactate dehydrogenase complex protein LldG [Pontibacter ummariensis]SNS03275.1 L-lactate dehydrogenase complex protein LldG [Pontibacter ummariensis]
MYEAKSKEIVLRRVREALAKSAPFLPPTPDFTSPLHQAVPNEDMSIIFAENFIRNSGVFIYCENEEDFFDQLYIYKKEQNLEHLYVWERNIQNVLYQAGINFKADEEDFVRDAEASLTTCEALITRTGSVLLSSANAGGRRLTIYPPTHMVVAKASQLVPDIKDGLQLVRNRYKENFPSMVSLVSGPSRTADIEKTLVMGAHGPKALVLFLIDDLPH